MSATATPVKDQHLALMLEMGADQYDPMPPGQYLAKKNERQTLTPRGQQLLAWIQEGCIRLKPGAPRGGRNAFATSDGKRPLKFTDAAAYFGWDMPAVSRVWSELQQKGYVKKDTLGRLCMIGEPVMQEDEPADEAPTDPTKVRIPGYVRQQFATNPRGREAETAYVKTMELINTMNAEAIAGTRAWGEKFLEAVMAFFDVKLRRHTDGEETENTAARKVQVNVLQMSVQDFLEGIIGESAQTTNDNVYSAETEPVQESHPYSSENKEFRVSREDTGTESGISCEDSLTPQDQEGEAEPENAAPAAPEPPAEETPKPSVDEETKPAAGDENNTVVAFVENYFEQPLNPTLRNQWANFAREAEVATASAVRFLMEKTTEMERREYDLEGAPAATLLKFARVDIRRWKKTNRAFIARDLEREEARRRPTAPVEAEIPEDPREPLIRTFEIERTFLELFPRHKDADASRRRFEDCREKLEQELARLLNRGAAATDHDRGMIQRIKDLLKPQAEGAAG